MMEKSKEIIIVDDEAGIRVLLSDALEQEGYSVTLAKDGEDSLRLLKNRQFDLMITDINMPHLNGIGLLKVMKKNRRKEKIILISGNPVDLDLLDKDTMPVFAQLKKPFRMNLFLDTVVSALESEGIRSKRRQNAA